MPDSSASPRSDPRAAAPPAGPSQGPKQYKVPTRFAIVFFGGLLLAAVGALSVPGLIPAVKGSNEAAAIGVLRMLTTEQSLYRAGDKDENRKMDYAPDLATLRRCGLIDREVGSGTKQGYLFRINHGDQFTWSATAVPAVPGKTGDRAFFVDESGIIRYSTTGQATSLDLPVES